MTTRTARRLVWALAVYTIAALAAAVWLTAGDLTSTLGDAPFIALLAGGLCAFATIGLVIAAKAPANPIGWLYAGGGIGMITGLTCNEYAIRASTNIDAPGAASAQFVSAVAITLSFSALILAILLFPSGAPPTDRWRIVGWWLVGATACGFVANALVPTTFEAGVGIFVDNPLHVPLLASLDWLGAIWGLGLVAAVLAVCASLGFRFLRSRGEERQQVRWLLFTVGLALVGTAIVLVAGDSTAGEIAWVMTLVSFLVAIPAATAVAVLRYRLYDLDLVIKKTVVFAITVALVMVVSLGLLLAASGPLTGFAPDETIAVGLAGLVIGALVWPLWRLATRIGDRLVYGGRSTPYEALTDFSQRLSEAYATDDVLPRMATVLGESTRAAEARIWLQIDGWLEPAAVWPPGGRTADRVRPSSDGLPAFPGTDRVVEVRHRGEMLGALTVVSHANDPIDSGREALMRDLSAQAGIVLRNVRLIEELRASRQRLVAAQDSERRRLERNIHDGAQQQLVSLGVKLRLADSMVDRDPARARDLMRQLQEETQAAIDDLRDLARGIYPPLLADRGLEAALAAQAKKSHTPVEVHADAIGRYDEEVEAAVYFSCLEALQNVAKYAAATTASITLTQRDGTLEFSVVDDGDGFDADLVERGSGLQGMADRVDAIGGMLTVTSAPGVGTAISGSVPVAGLRR